MVEKTSDRFFRSAAVEAARMWLRPILMTSFAFILGVFPLVVAQELRGAGQAERGGDSGPEMAVKESTQRIERALCNHGQNRP
jgi:multidrug efflux pump subunit AcrB